jgi:hypothetical protein
MYASHINKIKTKEPKILLIIVSVTTPTWDHETFKLGYAMDAQW